MKDLNSKAIILLLGERMKSYRIDYPLTQKELSDKSGISVRCIQNFEHGEDIQLGNMIKIVKALDLDDNLLLLVPDVMARPSMLLEKEKKRKRARKKIETDRSTFKWGDME